MSAARSPRGGARPLGLFRAALRVARKELSEGFRDRQTLIYTFVLPVCMYPALFWIMVQGVLVVQGQHGGGQGAGVALVDQHAGLPVDDGVGDARHRPVDPLPP